ncbi:phenylacetate--CoA ligase [Sphingomonas sp. CL5.1]|uniref:hypothetical protein n=1 Tax=Sphingomonas sp. CL5.1 TaxID=2653203 RepID=UPI001583004C|nr:hypothetical protein [Sphingomonas sp. CL5.1]QKS00301.1 phenylacetate--CoA ligase [Sphingomonas sp. CL5.1]
MDADRGRLGAAELQEGRSMNYPDFLEPIERATRAELDAHQEAALGAITRHAFENAPLIRQQWDAAGITPSAIKSVADFVAKAPLIDKDDVRRFRDAHNDPSGGMSKLLPGETMSIGTTSGTTGDPTPVPNWVVAPSEVGYARDTWHMGVVCHGKTGPILKRVRLSMRIGERHGTSAIYAGTDHREAA